MRAALENPLNQKFVLLSESGIPLYPPTTTYQQLLTEPKSRINACRHKVPTSAASLASSTPSLSLCLYGVCVWGGGDTNIKGVCAIFTARVVYGNTNTLVEVLQRVYIIIVIIARLALQQMSEVMPEPNPPLGLCCSF